MRRGERGDEERREKRSGAGREVMRREEREG
jgi:hypothetical protein